MNLPRPGTFAEGRRLVHRERAAASVAEVDFESIPGLPGQGDLDGFVATCGVSVHSITSKLSIIPRPNDRAWARRTMSGGVFRSSWGESRRHSWPCRATRSIRVREEPLVDAPGDRIHAGRGLGLTECGLSEPA